MATAQAIIRSQMVLDDRDFQKKASNVSRRTKTMGKDFERMSRTASTSFAKVGRSLAKLALAGAVINRVRNLSREVQELDKAARQLRISAEELQGLEFIASQNHVDLRTMTNAMARMNRQLGAGGSTADRMTAALARWGINARSFQRAGMTEQLIMLRNAFHEAGDSAQNFQTGYELMQRDFVKLAPIFDATEASLRRLARDGVRFSNEEVRRLNDEIDALNAGLREFDKAGVKFLSWLGFAARGAQDLTDIIRIFTGESDKASNNVKQWLGLQVATPAPIDPRTLEPNTKRGNSVIDQLRAQAEALNAALEEAQRRLRQIAPGRSSLELALGANAPGYAPAPGVLEKGVKFANEVLEKKADEQVKKLEAIRKLIEAAEEGPDDIGTL